MGVEVIIEDIRPGKQDIILENIIYLHGGSHPWLRIKRHDKQVALIICCDDSEA